MTPSSVRRAAERKERESLRAEYEAAMKRARGAAMPVPTPHEPEPVPVFPPPAFEPEPDEDQQERKTPPPSTSRGQYGGLVMAGESPEELEEFSQQLFEHYSPANCEEQLLVWRLVESRWFLRRRQSIFDKTEAAIYAAQPDPTKWTADDFKRLATVEAYCAEAEQVVNRVQQRVDAFMQRRTDERRFQNTMDAAYNNWLLRRKKYEFSLWKAGLATLKSSESEPEEEPKAPKKKVTVQ